MKLDFKLQKYFGSHLRIHTPVSMSILGIQEQIDRKTAEIAEIKEDRYIKILRLQNAEFERQALLNKEKSDQQKTLEEEIKQLKKYNSNLLAKIEAMSEKDKNLDRLQKENEILKAKVVRNIENEENEKHIDHFDHLEEIKGEAETEVEPEKRSRNDENQDIIEEGADLEQHEMKMKDKAN